MEGAKDVGKRLNLSDNQGKDHSLHDALQGFAFEVTAVRSAATAEALRYFASILTTKYVNSFPASTNN